MNLEHYQELKAASIEILGRYFINGRYIVEHDVLAKTMIPEIVKLMMERVEVSAFSAATINYAYKRARPEESIYFDDPHKGAIAKIFTGTGTLSIPSLKGMQTVYGTALNQSVEPNLRMMVAGHIFQFFCNDLAPTDAKEVVAMANATGWSAIKFSRDMLNAFSDMR